MASLPSGSISWWCILIQGKLTRRNVIFQLSVISYSGLFYNVGKLIKVGSTWRRIIDPYCENTYG